MKGCWKGASILKLSSVCSFFYNTWLCYKLLQKYWLKTTQTCPAGMAHGLSVDLWTGRKRPLSEPQLKPPPHSGNCFLRLPWRWEIQGFLLGTSWGVIYYPPLVLKSLLSLLSNHSSLLSVLIISFPDLTCHLPHPRRGYAWFDGHMHLAIVEVRASDLSTQCH